MLTVSLFLDYSLSLALMKTFLGFILPNMLFIFLSFLKKDLFIIMLTCISVSHVCLPGACGGQKALDLLGLGLGMGVSAGNKPWFSARIGSALHSAISPALSCLFLCDWI